MRLDFATVDELCAGVSLRPRQPTIDLSGVTSIDPYALVYLGQYLRHHNSRGKHFQVKLATNVAAAKHMARQRFFERFNFDPSTIPGDKLVPLTPKTSLEDIVDIERKEYIAEEITDAVIDVLAAAGARVDITAIADVLSEIIDNFAQHSGQQLASLAMQYRPRWHQIAIALGDCGVGIRQSLATQPKYSYLKKRPDWLAARMAFEPLVTSKREGGMGLVDAKESILHMGGRLFLSTGKGYVEFSGARTYYGDMAYNLPGVQIILSIPERT